MLKKIYNWFTEGSDSADLKQAKALLDELKGLIEAAPPARLRISEAPRQNRTSRRRRSRPIQADVRKYLRCSIPIDMSRRPP